MDQLFDDLARILATSHSRRKLFRLIGGVFASAVVGAFAVQPLSATSCTPDQIKYGAKPCGPNPDPGDEHAPPGVCCPTDTCCAIGGQNQAGQCCLKNQCYCANGRCAASSGGRCPGGCTLCA
jgi:hypothetical protein